MVVLMLAAILAAIAIPGMQTLMQSSNFSSSQVNWLSTLANARTEAVTRNLPVSLCVSADQSTCDGSGTGNWESGWVMFVDDGNGGGIAQDRTRQANEEIIQVGSAFTGDMTLRTRVYPDVEAVMFRANGTAANVGSWVLCDSRGVSAARVFNVNQVGQVSLAFDSNADGTREAVDGSEVTSCP